MKLAFDPNHPENAGEARAVPADWLPHIVAWARPLFYQKDFGAVLVQELVSGEFAIFSWTLKIEKKICLYPVAKMPTIALQFTTEGNITCSLAGFGQKILEKGSYEMFYVPIGINEAWFEPGLYESLHIELQPSYFEDLIAIRPEFGDLVSGMLGSSSLGIPMAVARMNYITRAILLNLRNCNKQGASLRLEIHKYILELLSEYFTGISLELADKSTGNIHHKDMMIKIKNHILLEPSIHEHTLERLARYFGISESLLKRAFKNNFNTTVSAFVRYHVLAKSHYLLTTTEKTIEEIAEEVGYAWRPGFEAAFKKYFGYSPSRIRHELNS